MTCSQNVRKDYMGRVADREATNGIVEIHNCEVCQKRKAKIPRYKNWKRETFKVL